MALVEGFGDEVIQFFGILFIIVLIILLWMSTQVVEMQIFRGAVFILERRTRRRHNIVLPPRVSQGTLIPSMRMFSKLFYSYCVLYISFIIFLFCSIDFIGYYMYSCICCIYYLVNGSTGMHNTEFRGH